MEQKQLSLWIYGIFVLVLVFVLGYFAGGGGSSPEIQVSVAPVEQAPVEQVPDEEAAETTPEPPAPDEPMDLNTADQAALETLPGIGPELASRILAYRETYGPFVDKMQLMDVEGIGEKRYAALEQLITVEVTDENSGRR